MALSILATAGWLVGQELLYRQRFHLAKAAFEQDHCPEAFEQFNACLNQRPHDRAALFWAARCLRRVDEFDLAEAALERCLDEPALADAIAFEQLLLRANQGDLDEVANDCRRLLEQKHPEDFLIREALIKGALSRFRADEARKMAAAWLEQRPDRPQAVFLDAQIDRSEALLQMQAAKLRRVVELDPQRGDARLMLAELLLDLGLAREASPHLEQLRKARPHDALIATRQAICFDLLGLQAEAVALIDVVLSQHPDFPLAQMTRGKLALRSGDPATAEVFLSKACGKLPGSLTARHHWAQCLRQQGKDAQAKAVDERIRALRDDNARLRAVIAKELPAAPRDARLQAELGALFMRLGSANDGLRWLRRAVQLDPKQREANLALADYYERERLFDRARSHRLAIAPSDR